MDLLPSIDWNAAILRAGSEELARELLSMLIESLPETKTDLENAWDRWDLYALEGHVHHLLGSASYCGVPRLKKVARQLEDYLRGPNQEQQKVIVLLREVLLAIEHLEEEYRLLSKR